MSNTSYKLHRDTCQQNNDNIKKGKCLVIRRRDRQRPGAHSFVRNARTRSTPASESGISHRQRFSD